MRIHHWLRLIGALLIVAAGTSAAEPAHSISANNVNELQKGGPPGAIIHKHSDHADH